MHSNNERLSGIQSLIDALPDAVWVRSQDGVVASNGVAKKLSPVVIAAIGEQSCASLLMECNQPRGGDASSPPSCAHCNASDRVVRYLNLPGFHDGATLSIVPMGSENRLADYSLVTLKSTPQVNTQYKGPLAVMERVITDAYSTHDALQQLIVMLRQSVQADQVWLLMPCDPAAEQWRVPITSCADDFPWGWEDGASFVVDDPTRSFFQQALSAQGALILPSPPELPLFRDHHSRSQMVLAVRGRECLFMLGIHQCRQERVWNRDACHLFESIGLRLRDIVDLWCLENKLQQQERAQCQQMDVGSDGILITSLQQRVSYANKQMLAILGADELGEIWAQPLHAIIHECFHAYVDTVCAQALAGEETSIGFVELFTMQGTLVELKLSCHAILFEGESALEWNFHDRRQIQGMEYKM
ncbi:MAG: GAF domain-containing protein, partial [Mariprofundales bacterium]